MHIIINTGGRIIKKKNISIRVCKLVYFVQVCKMPLMLKNQQVIDTIWNASQVSASLGDHLILTLLYVHEFGISVNSNNDTVSP